MIQQNVAKTFAKVSVLGLMACVSIGLIGCDAWERLKKANTVAIVSYNFNEELIAFDSAGNVTSKPNDVGVGEATGALGSLFGGNAVETVKKTATDRDTRNAKSQSNYDNFKRNVVDQMPGLLSKARLKVLPFDALPSLDLNNDSLSKGLVADSGADAIVAVVIEAGYVQDETGMFGLTKNYRLAMKSTIYLSDKEGDIGYVQYFTTAPNKRSSDGGLPVFEAEDFNAILKSTMAQLQSKIVESKLK